MLRKIHIEKITHAILNVLLEKGLLISPSELVSSNIAGIITQNMEAEHALDEEAHKLLDKHLRASGADVDEQKAFAMIKRQLAKQRGFVI